MNEPESRDRSPRQLLSAAAFWYALTVVLLVLAAVSWRRAETAFALLYLVLAAVALVRARYRRRL